MPRVEALEALQVTNLLLHPLALLLDLGLRQQAPPASWNAALPSPKETSTASKLAAVAGPDSAAPAWGALSRAGLSPGVSLAPAPVGKGAGDAWFGAFQTAGDLLADPLGGEANPGSASAFSPGGNGAASRTAAGENETTDATPEFGDRALAPSTTAPGAANHDSSSPQDLLADLALTWTPSSGAGAEAADGSGVVSAAGAPASVRGGLVFEPNVGQAASQVQYLARGRGYGIFLTSSEAVLTLSRPAGSRTATTANVVRMQVVGGRSSVQATGVNLLRSKTNYFLGRDSRQWRTNIANYGKVQFANVYTGIDLVYYGTTQRQLEYDFVVRPGADPRTIQLAFQGTTGLRLDPRGNLVISTSGGDIVQPAPVLYQLVGGARRAVSGGYVLPGGGRVAFQVGTYNPALPLYIDPVVSYSTYLGGNSDEEGNAVAVDSAGNAYVTGLTTSGNFPVTDQSSLLGAPNVFVTKFNATGSERIYSTYLGGTQSDVATGIAVSADGSAFITGRTSSPDYPAPTGAYQTGLMGSGTNAFVTKLGPQGDALSYSTYLGRGGDEGNAITVDSAGNAYVTGSTLAQNFPRVQALSQGNGPRGGKDAFVSKLNSSGSALLFSTYLGGNLEDEGRGIGLDGSGRIYVGGLTASTNLPTLSAWQPSNAGGQRGFVASMTPGSSGLVYLTYLGGSGADAVNALAVAADGTAYVTGSTTSTDFITTGGVYQQMWGSGTGSKAFVTALYSWGSTPLYSTFLGGADGDVGKGIALAPDSSVFVTGSTVSSNFPVLDPFQTAGYAGGGDAFLTRLNAAGSALVTSSFLGGRLSEVGNGVASDRFANAFVAGTTFSTDFPFTPGAYQTGLAGGSGSDAFVTKVAPRAVVVLNPGNQAGAEGDAVALQVEASVANGPPTFGSSGLPPGLVLDADTGLISGTLDYTAAQTQGGVYPVTVTAFDNQGVSESQAFTWTVANTNTTPRLEFLSDQTNWENDAVAFPLGAEDDDGDSLTFSALGLPSGLSINTSTGLISGVITATAAAYPVTVTVRDSAFNTATRSFTWTVRRVAIDSLTDRTSLAGDAISLQVNAWTISGQTLAYGASGLPPGLNMNQTSGRISGTIQTSASGTYTATVMATAGTVTANETFTWTVKPFALPEVGNQIDAEGDSVTLDMAILGNIPLTASYLANGLPPGLNINQTTGVISGTVNNLAANNSPYNVTVSATTSAGTDTANFTWEIIHILLNNPGSQISAPGGAVSLQIQATDPNGDPLTFGANGLPPGLNISSTGLISGTVSGSAAGGPYTVTVTASDGPHTTGQTFAWTVTNGAVSVTNPGSQSNLEGDTVSLQVNASDPGNFPLSYRAVGLPPGLSMDYATGRIAGVIDPAAVGPAGGSFQAVVMADNGRGGTGSQTFTWTVTNVNQAPVMLRPGDQVNRNGDVVSFPVFGYDLDGTTVSYMANNLPLGLNIASDTGIISGTISAAASGSSPYAATVTASDGVLTASQTFTWTVTDGSVTVTNPGDRTNAEGETVSLQVVANNPFGLPLIYSAIGLPDGLNISPTSGVISGVVSLTAADTVGLYQVTVTARDSSGHGGGQIFSWSITNTAQAPTLASPGSQSNAEGSAVSFQLQPTNPDGVPLTFAARGLPPGAFIDAFTGRIFGTVHYAAAQVAGGSYTPTVFVNDGRGNTANASFTWTVSDTNRRPWVGNVGRQNSRVGEAVSLKTWAGDYDGDTVSFDAVGLPAGLDINHSTGLISGTVSGGPAQYATTVVATAGGQSTSRAFSWNVSGSYAPRVLLAIQGTDDPTDDVAWMNSTRGPVPVRVTLLGASPGLHQVGLDLTPAAYSTLNTSSFQLANGGTKTVFLTPQQVSQVEDDVQVLALVDGVVVADAKTTNNKVDIPHVRGKYTPAEMKDRIPNNKVVTEVELRVSVEFGDKGKQLFVLKKGESFDNGRFDFYNSEEKKGYDATSATGSSTLLVRGLERTEPGHAGELYLDMGNKNIFEYTSYRFSVAPIPIAIQMGSVRLLQGEDLAPVNSRDYAFGWGASYRVTYISDSGLDRERDLDQVRISEQLKVQEAKGAEEVLLADVVSSSFRPVTDKDADRHAAVHDEPKDGRPDLARARAAGALRNLIDTRGEGIGKVLQFFVFTDKRTGYTDEKKPIIVPKSGFEVTFELEKKGGTYTIFTTKVAKANNGAEKGLISDADSKKQPVEFR